MRKRTIRSGLRFMAIGMMLVMIATFFPAQASNVLFLGMANEAHITFFGFFLGGAFGGWGVLTAAVGLLQTARPGETQVRLLPTVMLLFSLVILFFVLTYNSVATVVNHPQLQRGESIDI